MSSVPEIRVLYFLFYLKKIVLKNNLQYSTVRSKFFRNTHSKICCMYNIYIVSPLAVSGSRHRIIIFVPVDSGHVHGFYSTINLVFN